MDEADIVVTEGKNVAGETAIDFLRAAIVLKVLMVGEDIDNEFGSQQEIAPVFKCMDDGEELTVPNWIVTFCFGEQGEVITHWVL